MKKSVAGRAFRKTVPVLVGYLFLGFSFGVLLTSSGFPAWLAPVMSVTLYAGSMQFVAVELMLGAFNLVNTAVVTLLVNARHLFYGLSLIEKYRGTGLYKIYLMFGLTDETYALVSSLEEPKGKESTRLYFFITLFDHIYWILGGVIGALAGTLISFPAKGLEFKYEFLAGMNDDVFPSYFSTQGGFISEEEKRLFYVAITRAKKELFISCSGRKSRLLTNIPEQFIDDVPSS